ncbi:diphthine--ammonia ligase [Candidatus Woesearchaeota archaeon]|nr:diphthine--ammonia ligase [Candidatus Woesearchaeota archaeon]
MELSGILKGKSLIGRHEWAARIDAIKKKAGAVTKQELKQSIVDAVKKRIPKKRFGILFSGGVDSVLIALICSQLNADFICYTVGMKNSKDIEYATKAAGALGFKLKAKEITEAELEKIAEKVTAIVGPDAVKVAIGCVVYAAIELAKKDVDTVFTGLGAEELFAGYHKYMKLKHDDINKKAWEELITAYERDLLRDTAIAGYFAINVLAPFHDIELTAKAMSVPGKEKIKNGCKKLILREIAEELGLPKEFAFREKQAAQFGAKTQKAIERLAKKRKMKTNEYVKKMYPIAALVSSGKDSIYAMHIMIKQGYDVKCMLSMKSKNPDSYMFHTPAVDMAGMQSESIGIPLISHYTKGEKEKELADLKALLKKAVSEYGIKGVVSGALYSKYQADRIAALCDELGIRSFTPLWHMDQEKEMREIIDAGFKFILTKVACEGLDKTWLGKVITHKEVDRLAELNRKIGINIAGEGGEFESLVIAGPLFNKKIKILDYDVIEESGNTAVMKITKAELE